MAKASFNSHFIGDGVVWVGSEYERANPQARPLLWSSRADLPDASPNFLWRIRVVVWAKRADAVALAIALEDLAMALGTAPGDLKLSRDDGATVLRTYRGCRFDAMTRREGPAQSRGDFEDTVTFVFVTVTDPE